jgi:hypothetical protein
VSERDAKLLALMQKYRAGDGLDPFARECLQIKTKASTIEQLNLNKVQRICHEKLERQREEKGWVRALILKGRQPGISTYVGARYYRRTSLWRGINTFILSHEQDSTDKLFAMVDRFQRNNPLAPHVGESNAKSLVFDKLESSYAVATAGSRGAGRGGTVHLFHGSEVAYWANAPAHFAASVQQIPLLPGTEIILESTSNGAGGEFYERCLDAEAGRGDYQLIFLPWFLSDGAEYTREPEPGFSLSNEGDDGEMSEQEYADIYGISVAQMCWRRYKILELRSPEAFRREYPAAPAEAWTAPPGMEPFINNTAVVRARKRQGIEAVGPLVLGVDPASNGGDRFSVAHRRGQVVQKVEYRNKIDHLEGTAWIRQLIDTLNPARVNIDAGNIGQAIITGLKSLGPRHADVVRAVNFGGTSQAKQAQPKMPGPRNRRAEMWARMRDWLIAAEPAKLPDMEALQTDICAPKLEPQLNNDFQLESKEKMKKRGVRSPDLADAVALTFAFNEYFANAQMQDSQPAVFGTHQDLPNSPSTGYIPPPVSPGATSWMG